MISILFLFSILNLASCYINVIRLTYTNNILLRGPIDEESASRVIYEINKAQNKSDLYLILDTPGGEVQQGMHIIDEVQRHEISCVAIRAYSMGFAILQACKTRYVVPSSSVMQHQISLGIGGELGKIQNYLAFVAQLEESLVELQSRRICMTPEYFSNKMNNDWWLYGHNIVTENVADEVIYLQCSPKLSNKNVTITRGSYTYIYSACPLITKEIDKFRDKKSNEITFVYGLRTYLPIYANLLTFSEKEI